MFSKTETLYKHLSQLYIIDTSKLWKLVAYKIYFLATLDH